jgi:hypothetical protein
METLLSALEIADLVRRKESAARVLDAFSPTRSGQPDLNAFCLGRRRRLHRCREAEIAVMKTTARSLRRAVLGQDVLPTRGLTTTGGPRLLADFVPGRRSRYAG